MTTRELTARHRGEADDLARRQVAAAAALERRHQVARRELAQRHERELTEHWRAERKERQR
jgi:hypothetical protein